MQPRAKRVMVAFSRRTMHALVVQRLMRFIGRFVVVGQMMEDGDVRTGIGWRRGKRRVVGVLVCTVIGRRSRWHVGLIADCV